MQPVLPAPRLSLLDGFRLCEGREAIALPPSTQRVLALLAIGQHPLPRLQISGTLWPDAPEPRSSGSLRSALWRLGRLAWALVSATRDYIELQPAVRVDYREACRAADRILGGDDPDHVDVAPLLRDPGELLPGWYDDWVVLERERYRQRRLRALEGLCRRYAASGRFSEACLAGLAAVASEPLRETSRRVLIEVYLGEGNYAEAGRQYRDYRQQLRAELGLEPSPHMSALMARISSSIATPG